MNRRLLATLLVTATVGCELVLGLDEKATAVPVHDAGDFATPCEASFCDDFDQDARAAHIAGAWELGPQVGRGAVQLDHDWSASAPASLQFDYLAADASTPNGATLEKRIGTTPQTAQLTLDYHHVHGSPVGHAPTIAALRMGTAPNRYSSYFGVRPDGSMVIFESIPKPDGSASVGMTVFDKGPNLHQGAMHRIVYVLEINETTSVARVSVDDVVLGERPASAHMFRGELTLAVGDESVDDNSDTWNFCIDNLVLEAH